MAWGACGVCGHEHRDGAHKTARQSHSGHSPQAFAKMRHVKKKLIVRKKMERLDFGCLVAMQASMDWCYSDQAVIV